MAISRSETTTRNIFELYMDISQLLTLLSDRDKKVSSVLHSNIGNIHQEENLAIFYRLSSQNIQDIENILLQRNSLCSLRTSYAYIVSVFPIKKAYNLKLYIDCIQLDQQISNQHT